MFTVEMLLVLKLFGIVILILLYFCSSTTIFFLLKYIVLCQYFFLRWSLRAKTCRRTDYDIINSY
jgi:hypothetical protein